MAEKTKRQVRARRKLGLRKRIIGTAAKPRLSVFRSANHIYAQLIDDDQRVTLGASSSLMVKAEEAGKKAAAVAVGEAIAAVASKVGITTVVFDRNGYLYHGRVAAVAAGARAGGLKF
jgi:large subunit ribosomal protein L18